jgi:hypothetical protein
VGREVNITSLKIAFRNKWRNRLNRREVIFKMQNSTLLIGGLIFTGVPQSYLSRTTD